MPRVILLFTFVDANWLRWAATPRLIILQSRMIPNLE